MRPWLRTKQCTLKLTSLCKRCASCSVSNVTNPYPLLTPARSTMIFVDLTLPYAENTRHSSDSVVSPLQQKQKTYQKLIRFSAQFLAYFVQHKNTDIRRNGHRNIILMHLLATTDLLRNSIPGTMSNLAGGWNIEVGRADQQNTPYHPWPLPPRSG